MSAPASALLALAAVAWLLLMLRVTLVAARMLQIEEYEVGRFLRWGVAPDWLMHRSVGAGAAAGAGGVAGAVLFPRSGVEVGAAAWLAGAAAAAVVWHWLPPKKQLVLTSRMRRILGVAAALAVVIAAALALAIAARAVAGAILVLLVLGASTMLGQLLLVLADVLLMPVEAAIRGRYLRRARARLRDVHPLVVAVAGSYGKTSTKHILASLLQPSVETLPTRKSFNTLMGITRVINEDLDARHRVFLVEMDAYAPGEIAVMCSVVHPRVAVLTSVGPQHLERFGSMDSIAAALYEVVGALPREGVALMHAGAGEIGHLAARAAAEGHAVATYGLAGESAGADGADVIASDVRLSGAGAHFRWQWPSRNLTRDLRIPLLGQHQVLNVTAALAVVVALGYDLDAAVGAAARLQHVEHRLQPLTGAGAVTVIDDSYNANPVGVHNGLDVLALMEGGRKILVTPGLVELGAVEESENRRYGEHAATVCDDVIVMQARPARALCEGLRAGGLAEEHIHVVRSLDAATALIGQIGRAGDVVLFANDLPDTYLAAV